MNRRELIQWISAGTVGIAVSNEASAERAYATAEVNAISNEQAVLVFKLTQPISEERRQRIIDVLEDWGRQQKIGIPVMLLPYGLDCEVLRYPVSSKEKEPCSDSEPSKSSSSAASR